MDKVFINALQVETIIGIHDWEREVRQTLLLDLELATDIRPAARNDDIDQTLNYQTICERLVDFISSSRFLLVETLAEEVASLLMQEFAVPWLRLRVSKPTAIVAAASVGVLIERGVR